MTPRPRYTAVLAGAALAVLSLLAVAGQPAARADTVSSMVQVGSSPRVVHITPDGSKVYVSNRLSNDLSVISTTTDHVIATVPAGLGPGAIHIGRDGRVYVPDREGNALTVIDSRNNSVISTIAVGLRPSAVDASPDNSRVVVTNERAGSVTIVDGGSLTEIATLDIGQAPHTVVLSPDGTKAYVADEVANNVTVIDIASAKPSVIGTIAVGLGPGSMQFVGSSRLFVANQGDGTVSIIDPATNAVRNTVRVGDAPHGLINTPDLSRVFVANEASGTVSALSADGQLLATIPVQENPQRLHVTADGLRAYVQNQGSDTVSVIDVGTLSVVQTVSVGSSPAALAILSSGKVYVANSRSNSVSIIQPASPVIAPPPTSANQGGQPSSAPTARASGTVKPGATPTATRTATAIALPSATRTAGAGAGSAAGGAGDSAASSGGGAPSWIWLAGALGIVLAISVGGYAARNRLRPYAAALVQRVDLLRKPSRR